MSIKYFELDGGICNSFRHVLSEFQNKNVSGNYSQIILFEEQSYSKLNYEYDSIFCEVENHKLGIIHNYRR